MSANETTAPKALDVKTRNLLIELVKKHPILYIYEGQIKEFESRNHRKQLWDEIGATLNLPGNFCMKKFRNLRTLYSNYYNTPSFKGGKSHDLKNRLDFLKDDQALPKTSKNNGDSTRVKRTSARVPTKRFTIRPDDENESYDSAFDTSNYKVVAEDDLTQEDLLAELPQQSKHAARDNSSSVSNHQRSASKLSNDQKQNTKEYKNPLLERYVAEQQPKREHGVAAVDDLTAFFSNMEQTTRKFSAQLQVKVKRMISDIIYDAEEQWLSEYKR